MLRLFILLRARDRAKRKVKELTSRQEIELTGGVGGGVGEGVGRGVGWRISKRCEQGRIEVSIRPSEAEKRETGRIVKLLLLLASHLPKRT